MAESVEATGKTVEDAIQNALEELGASRDAVTVRVISAGTGGLFGIGGDETRVLVELKPEGASEEVEEVEAPAESAAPEAPDLPLAQEQLDDATELLREFFHHLGSAVTVEVTGTEPLRLNVSGEGTDAFVGKRGTTLRSIQFLYNLMLTKQLGEHDLVVVDIGGYRQRREELLTGMARRLADLVRENGKAITLEAMPPHERRIIHLTLAEDDDVATHSTGTGDERRVVIELQSSEDQAQE
ncbi:MAG: Jag N-terminal domain-containing protein [Chloroflexota bacterium]|nr:Jag N-terminal domain-containing protein [Chloroflexota bacterium]MDE2841470.1 Jag N-terminal domain-containing protein [Chloroflexota bacterium]